MKDNQEKEQADSINMKKSREKILLEKCQGILKAEGIPAAEEIIGPVINERVRSRFGSCRKINGEKRRSTEYIIELSGRLIASEDHAVETVLLHELLHTCPGCMNHGKRWKGYADRLNRKYGYDIRPSSRYEEFGLEDPGSREPVRYRIVCRNCGMEITRKRRCRLVENTDRYRCGKCGGKLEIR